VKRISCSTCGPRNEYEFTSGGAADIVRPDPARCSESEWVDYLFNRRNPRGIHHERWCHTYGCGQWFHVARNTVTHRIECVYPISQRPTDATG
jgi:sarcosine oxidase subunit delta